MSHVSAPALGGEVESDIKGTRADPSYELAKALVLEHQRASVSLVQRSLRIGYNHAAQLVAAMEGDILGPPNEQGIRRLLEPHTPAALLYCWTAASFYVLVPKARGNGYLRVPYGHHLAAALEKIASAAGCDVYGLDGALEFTVGPALFCMRDERAAFERMVVPALETHYGRPSRLVSESEFWAKHPIAALRPRERRKENP